MIEKDKELENLFLSSAPDLTDDEQFMTALERKMNAVEFLKEEQENQKRSYRLAIGVALVLGVFCGVGLCCLPLDMITFQIPECLSKFMPQPQLLFTAGLALLTSACVVSVSMLAVSFLHE
ncbi:MAG: hypothetical protein MJZ83_04080 [Bacteroidaceae bacterium]|nr:hypothetical protein [Bacteroidaceae bacterium]